MREKLYVVDIDETITYNQFRAKEIYGYGTPEEAKEAFRKIMEEIRTFNKKVDGGSDGNVCNSESAEQ